MGVVEGAGEGCEEWIGKRVIACPSGATEGFAKYAAADEDMVFEAPPCLDDAQAAAIFFPFPKAMVSKEGRQTVGRGVIRLKNGESTGA